MLATPATRNTPEPRLTTDTWIGDRGASLQIRGGYVSGVVMDPVLQTFDYYSASHDYFWLHSETIKDAYSSAHGSYGSGEAWSSAMYASASAIHFRRHLYEPRR